MRLAQVNIEVVGFVDSEGVLHTSAVESQEAEISLVGWSDVYGTMVSFDAPAYELRGWCDNHSFEYFRGELEAEVEMESE